MMSSSNRHRRNEDHLTDAELNELIDGTLAAAATERAQTHLAACAECDERYRTLQATVSALRSAPSLMPRRTFQLSPGQARRPEPTPGRFDRISAWVLPGIPVIRAVTLAVALLLISVTAIDVLTHRGNTGEQAGPTLMQQPGELQQSESATDFVAPTSMPMLGAMESEDSSAPPESAPAQRAADMTAETDASNEAPQSANGAAVAPAESSPVAFEAPPAPATAASPPPTASPIESIPVPGVDTGSGGAHISRWRIVELALLMLLIWLGVTWIGRVVAGDRTESGDPE